MKKISLIFIALLAFCGGCQKRVNVFVPLHEAGHTYVRGDIVGKVVWSGKVYLNTEIKVKNGATLVIEPGTEIFFKKLDTTGDGIGDAKISVEPMASIKAKGTYDKKIIFTSLGKNPSEGDWSGIHLTKGNISEFYHCDFKYSSWAFHFHYTNIVIDHCRFVHNTGGMRFRGGDVYVSNNLFKGNGIAMRFWYAKPKIQGNTFIENQKGIVFGSKCGKSLVRDNNFIKNKFHVLLRDEHKTGIAMPNNYWGTSSKEDIEKHIFHRHDKKSLGLVKYEPFYSSEVRRP